MDKSWREKQKRLATLLRQWLEKDGLDENETHEYLTLSSFALTKEDRIRHQLIGAIHAYAELPDEHKLPVFRDKDFPSVPINAIAKLCLQRIEEIIILKKQLEKLQACVDELTGGSTK